MSTQVQVNAKRGKLAETTTKLKLPLHLINALDSELR